MGLSVEWLPFEDVVRYQEKIMGNSTEANPEFATPHSTTKDLMQHSTSTKANRVPSSEHHTPLTDALCSELFHDGGPVRHVTWACSEDSAAQIADHARRMEADRAELIRALEPFAEFASQFAAKPITGLGDQFYTIHAGTEWEASARLSDFRRAHAALQKVRGE